MMVCSGVTLACFGIFLLSVASTATVSYETENVLPDEKWGYVKVRAHAHMFWWFYGAQVAPTARVRTPLVIWLQGGPGGSGTGFGNFMEIGPLDVTLKPRNSTWLKKANLLFIDNPVGSGYSYVTDDTAYTRNVTQIAEDLLTTMKAFFNVLPVLRNTPLYIFSESYGGKMTAVFGLRLYEASRDGEIECRLDGVALGDSWISPVDSVATWGPYLYQYNLLDDKDLAAVMKAAKATVDAVSAGMYSIASKLVGATEEQITSLTDNVNVYNVLQHNVVVSSSIISEVIKGSGSSQFDNLYLRHVGIYYSDPLTTLMNGPIKKKLGIPENVIWGSQSQKVFQYQGVELMKPVISYVSKLLNNYVPVVVYQGQLDMICGTPGAELWMKRIDWPGLENFLSVDRVPIYLDGDKTRNTAAFVKKWDPLTLYYIMKAGHMVPSDAPHMALKMLTEVISKSDYLH